MESSELERPHMIFEDRIGNPLRIVEAYLELLTHDDLTDEQKINYKQLVTEFWPHIFEHAMELKDQNLCLPSFDALLALKDHDPFDPKTLKALNEQFDLIRRRPKT